MISKTLRIHIMKQIYTILIKERLAYLKYTFLVFQHFQLFGVKSSKVHFRLFKKLPTILAFNKVLAI